MTRGSPDPSMLAAIQKKESFNEIFVNYFKENKIEIAHAIPKLFPFLESLKDRSFITDRFYADSYEAFGNSVPVEKVVYNVLDHLEKFGWSFLCTLFNRTNLNAYPGLREIHKSLETELEDKYLSQRSKQDQKLATVQPYYEQGAGDSCSQGSLTRTPSDLCSSDGAIQSGSRKRLSESTWDVKPKYTNTDHSIFHPLESHQTNYERAQAGTNPDTHENRTQPCFVKQKNLQKPGTMQNQEDEVIVISSDGSEGSDEDDEKELLEVFTLTPGVRRQMEEEGEDHVPWAPELRTSFRNSHLLFPDSPFLGDIEEPSRPFSAPYFF